MRFTDHDADLMRQLYAGGMIPSQIALKFELMTDDVYQALGLQRTYQGVRWSKDERDACHALILAATAANETPDARAISAELESRFNRSFCRLTISRKIRGVMKPPIRAYCRREKARFVRMATSSKISLEQSIGRFTRTTGKPLHVGTAKKWLARESFREPLCPQK